MTPLMLVLVFLLQNEGTRGKILHYYIYHKPGDNVLLPNIQVSFRETKCSDFDWLYYKHQHSSSTDVRDGEVNQESPRSSRLSLTTNCSLTFNNITAEDFGLYTCRYKPDSTFDTQVYLNILTISSSSEDKDLNKDREVTLTCSLWRYQRPCESGSLRWLNESGAELGGEDDEFKYGGQKNCASYLTVKNPTEHRRRLTCQYVDEAMVKVEVHYDIRSSVMIEAPAHDRSIIFIAAGAAGLLLLLLVIAVILLKCRRRQVRVPNDVLKPTNNAPEQAEGAYATINECQTAECQDEAGMTYATVNHSKKKKDQKKKVNVEERVEEVTYSTVRTR